MKAISDCDRIEVDPVNARVRILATAGTGDAINLSNPSTLRGTTGRGIHDLRPD